MGVRRLIPVLAALFLCMSLRRFVQAQTGAPQVSPAPQVQSYQAPGELGSIDASAVFTFLPSLQGRTAAVVTQQANPPSTLAFYNTITGATLWKDSFPENDVHTLAFSGNGRWVAVGGVMTPPIERREVVLTHGVVRIFGTQKGQVRNVLRVAPTGFIHSLALAPREPLLAVGGNSWIELWNFATGKKLGTLGMKGEVTSLAFSPDGTRLAGASLWSPPTLWNVKTRRRVAEFPYQGNQTFCVAFAPDGKRIALAGNAFVSLYTVASRQKQWLTERNYGVDPSYRKLPGSLSFAPDGRLVGISGISAGVLDARTGKIVHELPSVSRFYLGPGQQAWGFQQMWDTETGRGSLPLMHWPTTKDLP